MTSALPCLDCGRLLPCACGLRYSGDLLDRADRAKWLDMFAEGDFEVHVDRRTGERYIDVCVCSNPTGSR